MNCHTHTPGIGFYVFLQQCPQIHSFLALHLGGVIASCLISIKAGNCKKMKFQNECGKTRDTSKLLYRQHKLLVATHPFFIHHLRCSLLSPKASQLVVCKSGIGLFGTLKPWHTRCTYTCAGKGEQLCHEALRGR